MTDEDDPTPPIPTRVVPTQAWRAEQQRKQAAYAAQRARYVAAWHRRMAGLPDEPEPVEEAHGTLTAGEGEGQGERGRRSRARGRVHDPRQGSLKLND